MESNNPQQPNQSIAAMSALAISEAIREGVRRAEWIGRQIMAIR
jgi:hypothetical protein